LNAYIQPVIRFRGNSIDVSLQGKLVGHFRDRKEDFEVGFPHILVRGVVIGSLQITLLGLARLNCPQSGYYAELDFKAKGFFHGKNNYVVGYIKHKSSKKTLYTIEGRWDDVLTITSTDTNEKSVFLDVHNAVKSRMVVTPVSAQEENESRRVWEKVTQSILGNNEDAALTEKTRVEDHQRALDAERKKAGTVWVPRLFEKMEEDYYMYKDLKPAVGKGLN